MILESQMELLKHNTPAFYSKRSFLGPPGPLGLSIFVRDLLLGFLIDGFIYTRTSGRWAPSAHLVSHLA